MYIHVIIPLHFDTCICFCFQLIADTEINVKNGAEVLDRLLKVEQIIYIHVLYLITFLIYFIFFSIYEFNFFSILNLNPHVIVFNKQFIYIHEVHVYI
jgi:hypothetical protein